ncbi:MAG: cbb3-type cytochrome oxidase assembly protein CcoS [Hyphomicrobiaceae bacterium]|nr:cbb3-type cytochrome oxidase assembly protein CcoS [Hyphomicrobiaceae bacterium]
MTSLVWLIPAALFLGGMGLAAFLWSLKSGQYDDLDGAAWRILEDRTPGGNETAAQPPSSAVSNSDDKDAGGSTQ